ncbi:MAG: Mth938-like domain-containing protein [Acidovorax sp.]|jgi:uncharacterized protein|nr:Mth938-like domain-containing protein [Acidovorax sp.]
MKFQPDKSDAPSITGYGPGWLAVNQAQQHHSLLVGSNGLLQAWDCSRFEELTAEHFAQLAEQPVEVVIFGSGAKLRFVPPAWLAPLMAKRIGVETMDTSAACRTFNVLSQEGRPVLAALLVE